jgi:hypothetical protein
MLAQHSAEILTELGVGPEAVDVLLGSGAVRGYAAPAPAPA